MNSPLEPTNNILDNQLATNLNNILNEIDTVKDLARGDFLSKCINDRLADALKVYGVEIDNTSEYLLAQASARVLKAVVKIQKRHDKEIILEQSSSATEEEEN